MSESGLLYASADTTVFSHVPYAEAARGVSKRAKSFSESDNESELNCSRSAVFIDPLTAWRRLPTDSLSQISVFNVEECMVRARYWFGRWNATIHPLVFLELRKEVCKVSACLLRAMVACGWEAYKQHANLGVCGCPKACLHTQAVNMCCGGSPHPERYGVEIRLGEQVVMASASAIGIKHDSSMAEPSTERNYKSKLSNLRDLHFHNFQCAIKSSGAVLFRTRLRLRLPSPKSAIDVAPVPQWIEMPVFLPSWTQREARSSQRDCGWFVCSCSPIDADRFKSSARFYPNGSGDHETNSKESGTLIDTLVCEGDHRTREVDDVLEVLTHSEAKGVNNFERTDIHSIGSCPTNANAGTNLNQYAENRTQVDDICNDKPCGLKNECTCPCHKVDGLLPWSMQQKSNVVETSKINPRASWWVRFSMNRVDTTCRPNLKEAKKCVDIPPQRRLLAWTYVHGRPRGPSAYQTIAVHPRVGLKGHADGEKRMKNGEMEASSISDDVSRNGQESCVHEATAKAAGQSPLNSDSEDFESTLSIEGNFSASNKIKPKRGPSKSKRKMAFAPCGGIRALLVETLQEVVQSDPIISSVRFTQSAEIAIENLLERTFLAMLLDAFDPSMQVAATYFQPMLNLLT
eukprot:Rmarinus@m.23105